MGVWVGVWVGVETIVACVLFAREERYSVAYARILDLTATHEGRCFIFEVNRMPSQERTICRTSSYYDS